jgi:putative ABC transport system ATP-binding protein
MLELRDLVKHYPAAEPVRAVDGVSLLLDPGEFVAMYGPSGSGKSTLLEAIAGFIEPDRGEVIFDGQDISGFTETERANYLLNGIGIVGQPRSLLRGALAWENAALKLWRTDPRGAKRQIEPLLVRLGLEERIDYRTSQLSMGECQRVMLAQALSTKPKLILADEPTGNLDSRRTREVLELLKELCEELGTAVLLATHDPQAVAFADRAFELHDGRLRPYMLDEAFALGAPAHGERA